MNQILILVDFYSSLLSNQTQRQQKKEREEYAYAGLDLRICVKMIETLYNLPFHILVPPNIKVRRFGIPMPSAMTVFSVVLLSYFLVTGGEYNLAATSALNDIFMYYMIYVAGIIYDVIVEPPSVGATVDEHGHSRPVAFMPYRVNGQYIMEGLASSFLFTIGGLGFIIMDQTHAPGKTNLNRLLLTAMGFTFILVSFFTTWLFMRMKLPSYLQP